MKANYELSTYVTNKIDELVGEPLAELNKEIDEQRNKIRAVVDETLNDLLYNISWRLDINIDDLTFGRYINKYSIIESKGGGEFKTARLKSLEDISGTYYADKNALINAVNVEIAINKAIKSTADIDAFIEPCAKKLADKIAAALNKFNTPTEGA